MVTRVTFDGVGADNGALARAIAELQAGGGGTLTPAQVTGFNLGQIISTTGVVYALSEVSSYVTCTGITLGVQALAGPSELAGWYCSVAGGNIAIYDDLSTAGTPIVPATALVVGPMPIFGAGTTGKMLLTTGCWVVLSGASTVRVFVQ